MCDKFNDEYILLTPSLLYLKRAGMIHVNKKKMRKINAMTGTKQITVFMRKKKTRIKIDIVVVKRRRSS